MVDDQLAKWPKWLKCYCGTGRAWWQAEQRRYMCNTGCGVSMIPDMNLTAVSNGIYRLTCEQAWDRSALDPQDRSSNVDIGSSHRPP